MKQLLARLLPITCIAFSINACSSGGNQMLVNDETAANASNAGAVLLSEQNNSAANPLNDRIDPPTVEMNIAGTNNESEQLISAPPPPPNWKVTRILDSSPTSTGQTHTQQTPIDTKDGYVYVVGIEPGPDGDGDGLRQTTSIRQGYAQDNGDWTWKSATISGNTIYDRWHTPPSVGIDRSGHIHVTYNMHNSPWQYVVSQQPHNLDYFEFKGQPVSDEQYAALEFENKTDFESLGTAQLPGSQITYPAFFKRPDGELYLTYRAAAKPARNFWERTMSGIIAIYDEQEKLWNMVGAAVEVDPDDVIESEGSPNSITAFAAETGWTVYHPKLDFGPAGDMHVSWFWRPGVAGSQSNRPCHAVTSDKTNFYTIQGSYLNLPVTSAVCGNVGYNNEDQFHTIADMKIDAEGQPHMLVSPVGAPRELLYFNKASQTWENEPSPSNATHLFFDGNGRQWAVAEGIKLFYRDSLDQGWTLHFETDHNDCFPKMVWNEAKNKAYIHTQDCQSNSATVYELSLTN